MKHSIGKTINNYKHNGTVAIISAVKKDGTATLQWVIPPKGHQKGEYAGSLPNITESQRQEGFNGGIKFNTAATSEESKNIEIKTKETTKKLTPYANSLDYTWKKGINETEYKKMLNIKTSARVSGCEPDGGIFFHNGLPAVVVEAKKQGKKGNAIERWGKNYDMLKKLNPNLIYVTFCQGEGFFNENTGERIMGLRALTDNTYSDNNYDNLWNRNEGTVRNFRTQNNGTDINMEEAVKESLKQYYNDNNTTNNLVL